MLRILLAVCLYPWGLKAKSVTLETTESKVTYIEEGRTLKLNVNYIYHGKEIVEVVWSFNGTVKVERGPTTVLSHDSRAQIFGQASLQLVNVSLADNGTFSVQATVDEILKVAQLNFTVIILAKPVAHLTCPTSVNVSEGMNFSCTCAGVSGSPLPHVSWFKNQTRIGTVGYINKELRLNGIDRYDAGTYICRVQNTNFTDEKKSTINVLYKPTNISFSSNRNRNLAVIDEPITLTCIANGNPKPKYRILFNGAMVRDSENGIVIIRAADPSDEGTYHCLASNSEGVLEAKMNMTARLNVTKSDDINPSTKSFGTPLVLDSTGMPNCNCKRCENKWYFMFITLIAGICLGVMLTYLMKWLEKKLKKKRNLSNPSNSCTAEENDPTYQELDVSQLNKFDVYQALKLPSQIQESADPVYEIRSASIVKRNEEIGQSIII